MDVRMKRLALAFALSAFSLGPLAMLGCTADEEDPPGTTVPVNGDVGDAGDTGDIEGDDVARGPGPGGLFDPPDVGRDDAPPPEPYRACPLVPRETPSSIEGICCFDDLDCADDDPRQPAWRCYQARCHDGGEGVCLRATLSPLACWTDRDCAADHHCQGSQFAGCAERAIAGEIMGTCVPRPGHTGIRP
jgi:hypothetical protein